MNALKTINENIIDRILAPAATFQEIVNVIKTDHGLTSRVLKLANSSYYSIPGGVSEVGKALQYLGVQTIVLVVLTSGKL